MKNERFVFRARKATAGISHVQQADSAANPLLSFGGCVCWKEELGGGGFWTAVMVSTYGPKRRCC